MVEYRKMFPEVWDAVQADPKQDLYDAVEIFKSYVVPEKPKPESQVTDEAAESGAEVHETSAEVHETSESKPTEEASSNEGAATSQAEQAEDAKPNWLVRMEQVQVWLDALPTASLPLIPTDQSSLSRAVIGLIEQAAIAGPTRVC
jgi:hypothetical protein